MGELAAQALERIDARVTKDLDYVADYRVVGASVIGRGHVLRGQPRDDSFELVCGADADKTWWFAAVADGAGSRSLSRHGATAATSAATARMFDEFLHGASLRAALAGAVEHARDAQLEQAAILKAPVSELSCTLLCLACVFDGERMSVATFQIGDGLIAVMTDQGAICPLAQADDDVPGQTVFLQSLDRDGGIERRLRIEELIERPQGLLIATDGVADDLIPWADNGPILAHELRGVAAADRMTAGARLGSVLDYEKLGSFDDRTLVIGWRRGRQPCE